MQQLYRRDKEVARIRHRDQLLFNRPQLEPFDLKKATTSSKPFDFISNTRLGPTLLVGEGNMSFKVGLDCDKDAPCSILPKGNDV